NQADKESWRNPDLAFAPIYAHVLRSKAGVRVLIGRRAPRGTGNVDEVAGHPLVVDPDRPAATVMQDFFYAWHNQPPTAEPAGSARVVQWSTTQGQLRLLRLDYPGTVRDLGEVAIVKPD